LLPAATSDAQSFTGEHYSGVSDRQHDQALVQFDGNR
jgi:hypothetical protein